jgi:endonuclease/exonuclease/phosphatase family metal-dependent hydrolase
LKTPKKLILPNKKWINARKRHAVIGKLTAGNKEILVYSVHTETSSMSRKKRMEQWDAILEHVIKQSGRYTFILIGGDFNTLFPKDAKTLVRKFSSAGFQCATDSTGLRPKVWSFG